MASMLTTIDNPFNPVTQWDDWYNFDEEKGYCTSGYLARIAITSDDLSEKQQDQAIEDAIDEIISLHPDGFYVKVLENGDTFLYNK